MIPFLGKQSRRDLRRRRPLPARRSRRCTWSRDNKCARQNNATPGVESLKYLLVIWSSNYKFLNICDAVLQIRPMIDITWSRDNKCAQQNNATPGMKYLLIHEVFYVLVIALELLVIVISKQTTSSSNWACILGVWEGLYIARWDEVRLV